MTEDLETALGHAWHSLQLRPSDRADILTYVDRLLDEVSA